MNNRIESMDTALAAMALLMLLQVGLVGCVQEVPLGGRCSASSCRGCCDAQGICQLGQAKNACGSNGGMCLPCEGQQQCASGVCQATGAGGGTGGGSAGGFGGSGNGGGGNNTGGGVGVIDQELVSGTRLRAVMTIGADGSRVGVVNSSGGLFWDTQLQVFCHMGYVYSHYCVPMWNHEQTGLFSDTTCTQILARRDSSLNGSFAGKSYQPLTAGIQRDGGTGYYASAQVYSGPLYSKSSSGPCAPAGMADGGQFQALGTEIPLSALVSIATVVE